MISGFLKSEIFLMAVATINIILLILYICNCVKLKKINKNYNSFMKKIGRGENIDDILKKYIMAVENVDEKNKEIEKYCDRLDKNISQCIQKIGMVRYSAFKDTGSDLSFALAMLDDNNDGVILNGIYSREMSNIYAKQVKNGSAINKLSEEEKQALEKALNVPNRYDVNE